MGSGIAECAAGSGFEVILRSRSQSTADATLAAIEKSLNKQIEKGKKTEEERDKTLSLVTGTSDLGALKDVDLVIESVVEDLSVKKELFNELDRITRDDAILATNTSTLPVIELAMQTGRPEKVCGIHFFNPAPVMALVEVVRPITASDETIASATAVRRGVREDARRGEGPGRASSSTPSCSPTSTTRCGSTSRVWLRSRTSTRP